LYFGPSTEIPLNFSKVTNPQLCVLLQIYYADRLEVEARLGLILDYVSGSEKDVFQHSLVWQRLFDIDLPFTPDRLHLTVVTKVLSQLNKTAFPSDSSRDMPSAATISDMIQARPEQGYHYLNRLLL
jgi:hypothetical protein